MVIPATELDGPDPSVLPDTVQIQTCLTHDYREELAELVEILNDPSLFGGKIKANVVPQLRNPEG